MVWMLMIAVAGFMSCGKGKDYQTASTLSVEGANIEASPFPAEIISHKTFWVKGGYGSLSLATSGCDGVSLFSIGSSGKARPFQVQQGRSVSVRGGTKYAFFALRPWFHRDDCRVVVGNHESSIIQKKVRANITVLKQLESAGNQLIVKLPSRPANVDSARLFFRVGNSWQQQNQFKWDGQDNVIGSVTLPLNEVEALLHLNEHWSYRRGAITR